MPAYHLYCDNHSLSAERILLFYILLVSIVNYLYRKNGLWIALVIFVIKIFKDNFIVKCPQWGCLRSRIWQIPLFSPILWMFYFRRRSSLEIRWYSKHDKCGQLSHLMPLNATHCLKTLFFLYWGGEHFNIANGRDVKWNLNLRVRGDIKIPHSGTKKNFTEMVVKQSKMQCVSKSYLHQLCN